MSVKLLVFKNDGTRKDLPVKQGVTVIGRGEDTQLRIPLSNISRRHCELKLAQGQLTVRDLQSANGTRVNNQQVNQAVLKAGDQLGIGPITFIVQVDGEPSDPPAVVSNFKTKPAGRPAGKSAAKSEMDLSSSRPMPGSKKADVSADPIAALEALAQQDEEDDPFKRL